MASDRFGDGRLRLFVALELPHVARERLAAWRDEAFGLRPDLRPVSADALHVTLVFLGSRDAAETEALAAAVTEAASGHAPCRLSPGAVRPVPRRRPRLVALELDDRDGHARALQAAVSAELERRGLYERESRRFWAHITLARVRRGARIGGLDLDAPPSEPLEAGRVTLYRSRLRPTGAEYEPLHSVALNRAA